MTGRVEGIGGVAGNCSKNSDGFIDRSKVRILLCDSDSNSLDEVFSLLCKCSYQVTSVRSPRQVIDALNAEGPDIDIILTEVDLPMAKGMKMLKYIMRDKELRRIPVIMMSAQDEISIVVKCLRLGAADYLVKPLRTNELLNLWTHMWRRRHMLGLTEKNILNYDFDPVGSDHSDANTNSTTLFSDDTDKKSKKYAYLEISLSTREEHESHGGAAEHSPQNLSKFRSEVQRTVDPQTGLKKCQLKIGESSAFITYVKSNMMRNDPCQVSIQGETSARGTRTGDDLQTRGKVVDTNTLGQENGDAWENCSGEDDMPSSSGVPESHSMERSCTPPMVSDFSLGRNNLKGVVEHPHLFQHPRNGPQVHLSGVGPHSSYPYYMSGMGNQVMMPSSSPQMYQKNLHGLQNRAPSPMLSQHGQRLQGPRMVGMPPFPYYPFGFCVQPSQITSSHPCLPIGVPASAEVKSGKADRREAALSKFRQKRKERCFDKKIRYVNRKRLAERRPRVRGQFVRKVKGVNVDLNLNGQPESASDEEGDEGVHAGDAFPD